MNYKKVLSVFFILFGVALIFLAVMYLFGQSPARLIHPLSSSITPPQEYPLKDFSFSYLKSQPSQPSQITIDEDLSQQENYQSHTFSYTTQGKKMTGQLNVPAAATPSGGFPVVLMLRGFVDPSIYQTGMGTKNGAAFFAANGYVTLAPDFLGFGGSDAPDKDALAARLHKPKNIINLISSLQTLPFIDPDKLVIWAHSNGGQIALSVLEISGKTIPTTLWAPVSKSFPYSILYYTDEYDDQGKALRRSLANFETKYDVYDYSIDRYWDWIKAPILLHQGTADDAVPVAWSDQLDQSLQDVDVDVTYYTYQGADHNLRPSWDTVVSRDLDFFNSHLNITPELEEE